MDRPGYHDYVQRLRELAGGQRPYVSRVSDPIWTITFREIPEPRHLTAFTFGVSDRDNAAWKNSKPELLICVESDDPAWPAAIGHAAKVNTDSVFKAGGAFDFGEPITEETQMSALFYYFPSVLGQESNLVMHDRRVGLVQAYPIYASELELLRRVGAVEFFKRLDLASVYDITRASVA